MSMYMFMACKGITPAMDCSKVFVFPCFPAIKNCKVPLRVIKSVCVCCCRGKLCNDVGKELL